MTSRVEWFHAVPEREVVHREELGLRRAAEGLRVIEADVRAPKVLTGKMEKNPSRPEAPAINMVLGELFTVSSKTPKTPTPTITEALKSHEGADAESFHGRESLANKESQLVWNR